MSLLRSNPAFRRFWTARAVSYAGDQLARTALLIAVYDRFGGSAMGLFLLCGILPRLFGPLLGALADRFDQRRLMVVCDLGQAALYLSIVVFLPPLPVLLALVTAAAFGATLFSPAGRSLLPAMVGDRLTAANAQLAMGMNIGIAAGPAVGGLLLGLTGLRTTLAVDVATFLLSALLVGGIRLAHRPEAPARSLGSLVGAGLAVVRDTPVVRAVSAGFFALVIFAALDNVAMIPLGRGELQADETAVGFLGTVYGLGMVLAPLALVRAQGALRTEAVLYTALLAIGAGTLTTAISPFLAAALVGQAISGAGAAWQHISSDTLIQQHVPAERLGVVFGTVYMFPYAAEAVAYTIGTPLLGLLGPRWLFVVSGVGVLATLAVVHQLISTALRPRLGV